MSSDQLSALGNVLILLRVDDRLQMLHGLPQLSKRCIECDRREADHVGWSKVRNDAATLEGFRDSRRVSVFDGDMSTAFGVFPGCSDRERIRSACEIGLFQ